MWAVCRSAIDSMFGRALGTGPQRQSSDELHRKRSDPGGEALGFWALLQAQTLRPALHQ